MISRLQKLWAFHERMMQREKAAAAESKTKSERDTFLRNMRYYQMRAEAIAEELRSGCREKHNNTNESQQQHNEGDADSETLEAPPD